MRRSVCGADGSSRLSVELRQCAQVAGERWASQVREMTMEEHRQVTGGWPGTMSEARYVVAAHVASRWDPLQRPQLGAANEEALACVVYSSARCWWNARQERVAKGEP